MLLRVLNVALAVSFIDSCLLDIRQLNVKGCLWLLMVTHLRAVEHRFQYEIMQFYVAHDIGVHALTTDRSVGT